MFAYKCLFLNKKGNLFCSKKKYVRAIAESMYKSNLVNFSLWLLLWTKLISYSGIVAN